MKKRIMTYVLALVLCFAVIVPSQAKAAAMAPVESIVQPALDRIIKKDMTTDQKIKACYSFLVYQFTHTGETAKANTHKIDLPQVPSMDSLALTGNSFYDTNFMWDMYVLFSTETSACKGFAAAFYVMLNKLGIECELWYGNYYTKSTGTKLPHAWNRVKVDGTWYWYDVDVEGKIYRRGTENDTRYVLYKKNTESFGSSHPDGELFYASTISGATPSAKATLSTAKPGSSSSLATLLPSNGTLTGTSTVTRDKDGKTTSWMVNGKAVISKITIEIPRIPGLKITLENVPDYAVYQEIVGSAGEFKLYFARLYDAAGKLEKQTTISFSKDVTVGAVQADNTIKPVRIKAGAVSPLTDFQMSVGGKLAVALTTGEIVAPAAKTLDKLSIFKETIAIHAVDAQFINEDLASTQFNYSPVNLREWQANK